MNRPKLIVIGGPTASGKTGFAVRLAQSFSAPILSADSRQFYREIPIGTAAPSLEEQAGVLHYFVQDRSIENDFSVGDYEREAMACLNQVYKEKDLAFLVGGSGLYLKAITEGLDEFPEVDPKIRIDLRQDFEHLGLSPLLKELNILDPEYFMTVDQSNHQRVLRALEVIRSSGKPFSSFRTGQKKKRNFDVLFLGLDLDRDELYARIHTRVDEMVKKGMKEEAKKVFPYREKNALQTVGYKEWFDHFDGHYSEEETIERIKQNTRRFAKRQMTWFKKVEGLIWVKPEKLEETQVLISRFLNDEPGENQ